MKLARLFLATALLLPGCGGERRLRMQDIETMDGADFLRARTINKIVFEVGMPALPVLIKKMRSASGDIEWIPQQPPVGSRPARYAIQSTISLILYIDYLQRHPKFEGVTSPALDTSLILSDWWTKQCAVIDAGGDYSLPSFMIPYGSQEERMRIIHSLKYQHILKEILHRNAEFKRMGYGSINEMLDARSKNKVQ